MASNDVSEVLPFDRFKRATIVMALCLILFGGVGLYVVAVIQSPVRFQCESSAEVRPTPTERLSSPVATPPAFTCSERRSGRPALARASAAALNGLFGGALAVGVISLGFEFGLRRRFGHDLLRFLGLRKALVLSGLSDVSPSTGLNVRARLEHVDEIVYLGRTADAWLQENFPMMLREAEKRQLHITISLPDPKDDGAMRTVAAAAGIEPALLGQSIDSFVSAVDNQWNIAEPRVVKGTRIRVVHPASLPLYDVVHATGFSAVLLPKPINHALADDRVALLFVEADDAFPRKWIAEALASLEKENEALLREKN